MTISQCLYFRYDNISSQDMGIWNVHIEQGMYQEPFVATRTIKEQKIRGRENPYHQGEEYEVLQYKVSFAFLDKFDRDKIRAVARWLCAPTYYKPLIFFETEQEIWEESVAYALTVESFDIIHSGLSEGYLSLTFRTNSPRKFSPVYLTPDIRIDEYYFIAPYQLISIPTNIEFENMGDIDLKPIIIISMRGAYFSMINLTNLGQKLAFTGLTPGEVLEIDCENEEISSSLGSTTYRFNNMSSDSVFIELIRGVNVLQCLGDFEFQIKYEFKYLV